MVTMDYTQPILSALETMRIGELAKREKTSTFKALAYKKAMTEIQRRGGPIHSFEDVAHLPAIGPKIADKIKEILATGQLAAAEHVKATLQIDVMDELLKIHGIGPVKARDLIAKGIRSVAELRTAVAADPSLLNETQKIGLKYYSSEEMRIPRSEMKIHEETLFAASLRRGITPLGAELREGTLTDFLPKGLTGEIAGSYRRGLPTSGDIDLLLTYRASLSHNKAVELFHEFLDGLDDEGYILDTLVAGDKKWMGYVKAGPKGVARRLDIMLTPPAEYPYAILYFTGSDQFNVAFRRWASEKGYTLNEHTMVPAEGRRATAVPGMRGERDIFEFLGLQYVGPQERTGGHKVVAL